MIYDIYKNGFVYIWWNKAIKLDLFFRKFWWWSYNWQCWSKPTDDNQNYVTSIIEYWSRGYLLSTGKHNWFIETEIFWSNNLQAQCCQLSTKIIRFDTVGLFWGYVKSQIHKNFQSIPELKDEIIFVWVLVLVDNSSNYVKLSIKRLNRRVELQEEAIWQILNIAHKCHDCHFNYQCLNFWKWLQIMCFVQS